MSPGPEKAAPSPRAVPWLGRLNRLVAVLIAVAVCVIVSIDALGHSVPSSDFQWQPATSPAARVTFRLLDAKYDHVQRAVVGTLEADVTAGQAETIEHVALAHTVNTDQTIDWISFAKCKPEFATSMLASGERGQESASLRCGTVTLPVDDSRSERWYPFDLYAVTLTPMACLNQPDGCLDAGPNTSPAVFSIRLADRTLRVSVTRRDDGRLRILLSRPAFLRSVTILFFVMSVFFLGNLATTPNATEFFGKALGFFGTLWALRSVLVAKTVETFPTVVDLAVISLFALVFAAALYRVGQVYDSEERHA
jgi:hypothetical protein